MTIANVKKMIYHIKASYMLTSICDVTIIHNQCIDIRIMQGFFYGCNPLITNGITIDVKVL